MNTLELQTYQRSETDKMQSSTESESKVQTIGLICSKTEDWTTLQLVYLEPACHKLQSHIKIIPKFDKRAIGLNVYGRVMSLFLVLCL